MDLRSLYLRHEKKRNVRQFKNVMIDIDPIWLNKIKVKPLEDIDAESDYQIDTNPRKYLIYQ